MADSQVLVAPPESIRQLGTATALAVLATCAALGVGSVVLGIWPVAMAVWSMYPGIATFLAVRSPSESVVTAAVALLPSLPIAYSIASTGRFQLPMAGIPSGVAIGIIVGMWAGSYLMRRRGIRGMVAGFVGAGLVAALVGGPISFVSAVFITATTH